MGSLLWGAALKALGDGGQAGAQAYAREDDAQRKLAQDADLKRERMQLDRDIAEARYGGLGGAGSGTSRAGAKGNVFGFKTVDEAAAAGVGIKPEDIPALEAGTYGAKVTPLQGPADEFGNGPGSVSSMSPELKALNASKLGDLNALRKTLVASGDVKDMADARLKDQERQNLDEYKGGSTRAGETALIGKGKGVYGGNSDVTRNEVSGSTATTDVGKAEIVKKKSESNENNAQAEKARRPPTGSGPEQMTLKERESERKRLKDLVSQAKDAEATATSKNRAQRAKDYEDALEAYRSFDERVRNGGLATPPAAAPASAPATRPPLSSFMKK